MAKAVQIARFGDVNELNLVDLDLPDPGPDEVRVRHRAIGLNFTDVYQRRGVHPVAFELPLRLGMEAAGVVEAVGGHVSHLGVGDRVAYATHPPGSYCEARVMPAQNVCRLPDGVSFEAGAAMMLKGLTAHYLLKRCRPPDGLQAGDFVLFHAAAGGVGLIFCQWARMLGLRVIATAGSDAKCALALEHGAEHAVNYGSRSFVDGVREITQGRGVRVAYDAVGKDTWEGSLACLGRFGLLVNFGDASGPVPPFPLSRLGGASLYATRQTLFNFTSSRDETQAMADDLFEIVGSGGVAIRVEQHYPLEEVRRAHRDLEARRTVGSSILTVAD